MVQRTTPGIGLASDYELGENGWKEGMDANLLKLSVLINTNVLSFVAALPGSPSEGDLHIITAGANQDRLALRDQEAWVFYTPLSGYRVFCSDDSLTYVYMDGDGWVAEHASGILQFEVTGGTANAISTSVNPRIDLSEPHLGWFLPAITNTGATTMAVNGGTALPVLDFEGNPVAAGYIREGVPVLFRATGADYRLMIDHRYQTLADAAAESAGIALAAAAAAQAGAGGLEFDTMALALAYHPDTAPDTVVLRYYDSDMDAGSGGSFKNNGTTEGDLVLTLSDDTLVGFDLTDMLPNVLQLGGKADYDPATGLGTDNTPIINALISRHAAVFLPAGWFMISGDGVDNLPWKSIIGVSRTVQKTGDDTAWDYPHYTALVPRDMNRSHVITKMITECELSGGVLDNPHAAEAYTATSGDRLDTYRLWDSTNKDAVGATRATQKLFSIAVKMHRGSLLSGVAIRTTNTDGSFTASSAATDFGDPCDFGVYALSPYAAKIERCDISQFFRVAAVAQIIDIETDGSGYVPQGDRFTIDDCYLEGHTCFMSRGYDAVRVLSATADSVTIAWFASHRFDTSGSVNINGTDYAYTGLDFTAGTPDTLTFTGMTGTGSFVDGDALCRAEDSAADYGTGGTMINNSFLRHMTVPGLKPSTHEDFTDRFDTSGKTIEISGAQVRGYHISNTYMHSRDDVCLFVNDGGDIYFVNSYHESKYNAAGGEGGNCARFIALGSAAKVARGVPYPINHAGSIHFVGWSQTEAGSDMRPTYRTAPRFGRFGTGSGIDDGLFEPEITSNETGYNYGSSAMGAAKFIRMHNVRGELHPLQITSNFGFIRASFDSAGRFAVGSGYDTEAALSYTMNVFSGAGGRCALFSDSTGTLGFRAENAAGNVQLLVQNDGRGTLNTNNTARVEFDASYFRPAADNVRSNGQASYRWTEIFAVAGAINTSDEREKEQIEAIQDLLLDAWADVQWVQFKWREAVAQKGANARLHFGLVAQRVRDVFAEHGLDPFALGLLCHDEWGTVYEDEYEQVEARISRIEKDRNTGQEVEVVEVILEDQATGAQRVVLEAGDRFGIRYEEADAIEHALVRRALERAGVPLA